MTVIVFGSINTDLALGVGHLPRPGETVLTAGYQAVPGGKGCNQAVAAARLGVARGIEVRMVGAVGDDAMAAIPLAALHNAGVDTKSVRICAEPTGLAAVMVAADGENAIVVASGANRSVRAEQLADVQAGDVLVCQMEVPVAETAAALQKAKAAGALTLLNLAPFGELPEAAWDAVDYWIVNELEAAGLARQIGLTATTDFPALARALARRLGAHLIATLGRAGAIAVTPAGEVWQAAALPVQVVDTTGAGDAFVGGLATALAERRSLPETLRLASAAAGLACTSFGAQTALPSAAAAERMLARVAIGTL